MTKPSLASAADDRLHIVGDLCGCAGDLRDEDAATIQHTDIRQREPLLVRQAHHGGEEPLRPTGLHVCNRLFGFVRGEIDVAMTRQGGQADERMN